MTAIADKIAVVATRLFPECLWDGISDRVARAFRMSAKEAESFRGGQIARLIGALPFLAGCEDAERTAVAHLGTYLLSVRETKCYFNTRPEDRSSVLERLRLISNFKGGDQKIIDRGLCLLGLNMVSDYHRDIEEDARLGKYNPIAAGDWDFEDTVADLEYRILCVPCQEMDEIVTMTSIPLSFWVK